LHGHTGGKDIGVGLGLSDQGLRRAVEEPQRNVDLGELDEEPEVGERADQGFERRTPRHADEVPLEPHAVDRHILSEQVAD